MMTMLAEVALLEDVPAKGLKRGQVGTVVEVLAPSVFEVEFSDDDGRAYAMAAVPVDKLIQLHHTQLNQTA
jgi:Domain of unknown function (DUF4926)